MNTVELDTHRTAFAEREGREAWIEELRRSRQYLAEAQKLTHTGSWAFSPVSGALLYWSEECYRILGFDPAHGLPSFDASAERIHPDDRPETLAKIDRHVRAGSDFEIEYRLLLPDGVVRNVRIFAHPVRDASGAVVEFIGTVVDVTEQKRVEEERREHRLEARLQATLNMVPAYTYYAAPNGALTFVNERCADYLGLPKDHPLRFGIETGAPWDAHIPLLHPDDQDESRSVWSTMLATGSAGEKSFRVRNAEGTYRWFLSRAEPLRASDGTLLYWVGINLDIEELKRAEFYLAEAQRLSHTGSWAWSPDSDVRHWSEECYRILGFDPRDSLPGTEELIQRIHPDDQPAFRESTERAKHTKLDEQQNYRIVHPSGAVSDIHSIGHPVFSPSGDLIEFVGTVMDVTERKRAEEERREHLWFLESMDRINRAMQGTNDVERMMSDVLEEILAIFDCDRAWLVYPCDPDAATSRAVMEHTRPEYPGAFALGVELPVDREAAEVFRRVLEGPGAVIDPLISREVCERFSIQSTAAIAVRPKSDRPYLLGLHQCSEPRRWTPAEARLLGEIARRLEDALTSLLAHRNLVASQEELRASEQRFRTFVDQATGAFFLYDDEDLVRDVNSQACDDLGYSREELIGMHPRQFNVGLTTEIVEGIRQRLREHGNATFNNLRRRRNGSVFPVEVRARTFDRGGRVFTIALATDITERRRREQCLLAQHRVTQALSEAAALEYPRSRVLYALCEALEWDFGVAWRVDEQAGVLRCVDTWSPSSAPRPGFEAAMRAATFEPGRELPGQAWSTGAPVCVRDSTIDRSSSHAELVAAEGLHAAFAFPVALKSGIYGVIEFFSREIRDADPEFLQMMATVGSQIGQFVERTRAEDALRTARSELTHVTRVMSLGELTASIAHEVNQPLGAMVTSAASASRWLAANPPNLEKASLALARIRADGERASAVIDRVRRLVKRQEPSQEPIDVNETVRGVVALMRDELERAGVAQAVRLADNLPPVFSDRVLLQQVILNLILNAIDAMRGIEDRARVLRIESRRDDSGEVLVEVRDTGTGLPPDARLFEAFYTTKEGGLGMGLSISRSIVEAHGGRMHARPNEPHGAIFEFSLPVTQP